MAEWNRNPQTGQVLRADRRADLVAEGERVRSEDREWLTLLEAKPKWKKLLERSRG